MILGTVTSTESLRGELAGVSVLALAAGDPSASDYHAAKIPLGLAPRAEHDGEPACDWCGRSNPPGGLEDQSLNGPPSHECHDSASCQTTRAEREPGWLVNQGGRWWRVDWQKYQEVQQYEAAQSARSRFGGGIYQLSQNVDDEFMVALAHVRQLVDQRAVGYGELFERVGELALAAGTAEPEQAPPPQVPREPKEGAAAVHPHLGKHLHRLPGETISKMAYGGEVTPPPAAKKPAPGRRRGWAARARRR